MTPPQAPQVHVATSTADACSLLGDLGDSGAVLAGGTWVMRAPLRGEQLCRDYVSLRDLHDLRRVRIDDEVRIGALVTHAQLGAVDGGHALRVVTEAAASSAFPQVRNVATVGGNLRSLGFAQADLVPALLAAEAGVELQRRDGTDRIALADYLGVRAARPADEIVTGVTVPTPTGRVSTYQRLTVRAAGEYAVASIAVSIDRDEQGAVRDARIAVGSVEQQARLLVDAAAALIGAPLSVRTAVEAGRRAGAGLVARDDADAPGWYRLAVLPHLVTRALSRLIAQA